MSRIPSLDPILINQIELYSVTSNIIESLFRRDPETGDFVALLGTKWMVDQKKRAIVIDLRPGVLFHDGSSFQAQDVVDSFRAYTSDRSGLWKIMWQGITSANVISPTRVEFKFNEFHYETLRNLLTSLRVFKYKNGSLLGTGPFRVKRFIVNRSLELEPNVRWWHPRSGESKSWQWSLLIKVLADQTAAEQLFQKHELDVYALPLDKVSTKALTTKVPVVAGPGFWLDINLRSPVLSSLKVREALLLLWDRVRLNSRLYEGKWELAVDAFAPGLSFYPKDNPEKFDPQKASQLLKDDGWKDSDHSGILEKFIDGKKVELSILLLVDSPQNERWATLFQADAKKLGIKVKLTRIEDPDRWYAVLKSGQFDALTGSGLLSTEVFASSWKTNGGYNFCHFSDVKSDHLLDELDFEVNPVKRAAIQRDLIKIIRQNYSQIPGLYSRFRSFLVSSRVRIETDAVDQAWRWSLKD